MTAARFDVPASNSRQRTFALPMYAQPEGIAYRFLRIIWLTARFTRHEPVTVADYRLRFGVSVRSFHRDIALLRQAGLYIDASTRGNYCLLCFLADADHA